MCGVWCVCAGGAFVLTQLDLRLAGIPYQLHELDKLFTKKVLADDEMNKGMDGLGNRDI